MGKFNKDIAKKVSLQTIGGGDGPSDSQGIEIKSPGKMYWFSIKGKTIEDLIEVTLQNFLIRTVNNKNI